MREHVWLMRSTDDIDDVMTAVGQNLWDLGVPFLYFGVNVVDPRANNDEVAAYTITNTGEWHYHGTLGSPLVVKFWQDAQVVYRPDVHRDDPYDERRGFDRKSPSIRTTPFWNSTILS